MSKQSYCPDVLTVGRLNDNTISVNVCCVVNTFLRKTLLGNYSHFVCIYTKQRSFCLVGEQLVTAYMYYIVSL